MRSPRTIERERNEVGRERFLTLSYGDICTEPERSLNEIFSFMDRMGARATRTGYSPKELRLSSGRKKDIGDEEYNALRRCLDELEDAS